MPFVNTAYAGYVFDALSISDVPSAQYEPTAAMDFPNAHKFSLHTIIIQRWITIGKVLRNCLNPEALRSGTLRCYIEPFGGSGAVIFDVMQRHVLDRVIIIDQNERLMHAYRMIQTAVEQLIDSLAAIQTHFWALDDIARRAFYYEIGDAFNHRRGTDIDQAAHFIFLNRTCFNGLYRVNRRGEFNVPMGRYQRPLICDADNLRHVNVALQQVTLLTGEYHQASIYASSDTFVYLDPPYRPLSTTASFTAYSANAFDDDDQRILVRFVRWLDQQGAYVMVSNSNPHNVDPHDNFFDDLYQGFHLTRLPARRTINSRSDRRGAISRVGRDQLSRSDGLIQI